jgi:hypothetical protein
LRLTPSTAKKVAYFRNSLTGSRDLVIFQGTYNASNDFLLRPGHDAVLMFDGGGSGATVTNVFTSLEATAVNTDTIDSLAGGGLITVMSALNLLGGLTSDDFLRVDGIAPDLRLFESDTTDLNLFLVLTGSILQFQERDDAGAYVATHLSLNLTNGALNLAGHLNGPTDPTAGTHVGDRDFNDARYLNDANDSVGNDNLADMAQSTIKGRAASSGTGDPVDLTATQARTLLNVEDGANNYTHPSHPGDDFTVDTGLLTGANVVSDIAINVNTDTEGHVTDTNGVVAIRTLTLANLGYTGDSNANNYSHPNHTGDVTSSGDGAQTIAVNAVTNAKAADMAQSTIKGRASGAGTGDPTDLTAAQVRTIINVADGANNYTHPSHPGDDFSVDTGALTGANVVSDIDINLTTDTQGHVTDANAAVSTRALTAANLGIDLAGVAVAGGTIVSDGAGAQSITNTFGISACSISGSAFRFTLSSAISPSTDMIPGVLGTGVFAAVSSGFGSVVSTTQFDIAISTVSGTTPDYSSGETAAGTTFSFVVYDVGR